MRFSKKLHKTFHQGAQNFLEVLSIFIAYQNLRVILAPVGLEVSLRQNNVGILISDTLAGLQEFLVKFLKTTTTASPHLANDEDVREPGGKAVACAVLDVHHIEGARVTLPVGDHTNTPQVSATGHHAQVT